MELLDKKTDKEILDSLTAEIAKCTNEIKCATQDIAKAHSRLSFSLVLLNALRDRLKV